MIARLRAVLAQRVAGVPVAVIFVVLVAVAVIVIRRRRARAAANPAADNPVDTDAVDDSTPVGAMAGGGGYAGAGYAFPQPTDSSSVDNTGNVTAGMLNGDAGDTTVTGEPVGQTSTPAQLTPNKVSPTKATHKAGKVHPVKAAPHPHAAKAPKKRTTVHKATPAPKPAHKAAPKPPAHHPAPAKKPAPKKPAPRRRTGTGHRATIT